MIKTIIAIPCDQSERNQMFLKQLLKSLEHFHPNSPKKEFDIRVFDNPNPNDKNFWYRSAPIVATQLLEEGYERIIKMDVDQIITGSLEDILNDTDEYDVGVVLNDPSWPIQVWDISHPNYVNNGFVVLKSKEFVDHWLKLCLSSHFQNYQYREQDFLTLLCSDYFNYKVKCLDTNKKVYGEVIKPQWTQTEVKDNKIMLGNTQICVIHFGGGNAPDKGNYRIRFPESVSQYIDKLIK